MQIHTETKTWKHTSANFTVEVVWWKRLSEKLLKDSLPFELRFSLPENHWNVYAYIYPKHQLFNKIENDSLFDYGIDLPLHCGSSYHSWIFNKNGEIESKKIGSDYSHLHDDFFGECATKEDAYEVFKDADMLIEFLKIKDSPANSSGAEPVQRLTAPCCSLRTLPEEPTTSA